MKAQPGYVLVRGAGDLGTGTAHRLHMAGFQVVMTELAQPTVIRRAVSFATAVYDSCIKVEGVEARLAKDGGDVETLLAQECVPVLVDALDKVIGWLEPEVIVDARLAKRNLGTRLDDAPVVVAMGPGFEAGADAHAVVETSRGHYLGRVILHGRAEEDTHVPGLVHGFGRERVLWAPCAGIFRATAEIGQAIRSGQETAQVDGEAVRSSIDGVLRGILRDGLAVTAGQKVGDVDPRGIAEYCFTISDKARAIGGGVLEAILYLRRHLTTNSATAKLDSERSGADDL